MLEDLVAHERNVCEVERPAQTEDEDAGHKHALLGLLDAAVVLGAGNVPQHGDLREDRLVDDDSCGLYSYGPTCGKTAS